MPKFLLPQLIIIISSGSKRKISEMKDIYIYIYISPDIYIYKETGEGERSESV